MISIYYATHDGHTRKIANAIAGYLISLRQDVSITDLGRETPDPQDLDESQTLVILAPIRFGYHLKPVDAFIAKYKKEIETKKLVLASVNLTARKQEKNTPQTNAYMRKWLRRHAIEPTLARVFAGQLNYGLYKMWEKWAIRLIMKMTGGPTSFNAVVDFTDWSGVESFAKDIAKLNNAKEEEAA